MKLIVFLGNPGTKYEKTKHNVGFMFFNYILNNVYQNNSQLLSKFDGKYSKDVQNNVIIAKPETYMNLSGDFVWRFAHFFKIRIEDILIVYDDFNFEVGDYKFKKNGSSGGHNGMNDIIYKLGTKNIKRLKIGIGTKNGDQKKFVLSDFNKQELKIINDLFKRIKHFVEDFSKIEFDNLMNKYNGK